MRASDFYMYRATSGDMDAFYSTTLRQHTVLIEHILANMAERLGTGSH